MAPACQDGHDRARAVCPFRDLRPPMARRWTSGGTRNGGSRWLSVPSRPLSAIMNHLFGPVTGMGEMDGNQSADSQQALAEDELRGLDHVRMARPATDPALLGPARLLVAGAGPGTGR